MFKGLGKWLFRSPEHRVTMLGGLSAGQTTLLYRLKLNEMVTTIPTIGFNIETVEDSRGWQWTFWDIGGGCSIIPSALMRHFLNPDTLVLFVVDCSHEEGRGFDDELRHRMNDLIDNGTRHLWVLLNKQDLVEPEVVSNLSKMYNEKLAEYKGNLSYRVLDHKLSAATGEGTQEVLDDLYATMSKAKLHHRKPQINLTAKAQEDIGGMSDADLTALVEKEGREDNVSLREFWASFLDANVPEWGHRSHLKAGYIVVLESLGKGDTIFDAAKNFLAHLKRLKDAHPDKFRNTEHQTMTIFWLLQLQLAIWNYKVSKGLDQHPAWEDFQAVLLHAPSLRNTRLWTLYYSRDSIFTPRAKESWIPPDLQQLPALLPNPDSKSTHPATQMGSGSLRLLRFAFTVTQYISASGLRRGEVLKEAFSSLEATTLRLRVIDSTIPPYSETQIYFWVQIVHAALKTIETRSSSSNSEKEPPILNLPASEISFANFSEIFNITPTSWKDYYSPKVWESIGARIAFVPPDIKPLPNVLGISPDVYKTEIF